MLPKRNLNTHHPILYVLFLTVPTILLAGCQLIPSSSLTVRWKTESELDIIGFNLYRSESEEGPFIRINEELIPPADDPFIGGEHVFVDENVKKGMTYYYQLESVDRYGKTTRSETIEIKA